MGGAKWNVAFDSTIWERVSRLPESMARGKRLRDSRMVEMARKRSMGLMGGWGDVVVELGHCRKGDVVAQSVGVMERKNNNGLLRIMM
jgi:hypothetical protein